MMAGYEDVPLHAASTDGGATIADADAGFFKTPPVAFGDFLLSTDDAAAAGFFRI